MGKPAREMWSHTGKCQCGRRTILFGQCSRCLRGEALDKLSRAKEEGLEDEPDMGSDVAYSLACTASSTSLFVSDVMAKELAMAAQGAKAGTRTLLNGVVAATWYTAQEAAGALASARSEYKHRAVWGLLEGGAVHFVHSCPVVRSRQCARPVDVCSAAIGFASLESNK